MGTRRARVSRRWAAMACVAIAVAACGDGDGDGGPGADGEAGGAVESLAARPAVADGLAEIGIDAGAGVTDPGRAGERVGSRLAMAVRDMMRLGPRAYRERWGAPATALAASLGRLVGALEEGADEVEDAARDERGAERALAAFGLAAAWTALERLDVRQDGEERLRAILPAEVREGRSLGDVAAELARELQAGRYGEVAGRLLDRYDDLDPDDLVAEIGSQLAKWIPARNDGDYLSAFLASLRAYDEAD